MSATTATAVVEYLDAPPVTITADTAEGVAGLRRFAESADQPGTTRLDDATVDGVRRPFVIVHEELAAVRLVTA